MRTIDKIVQILGSRGIQHYAFEDRCKLPRGRLHKWKNISGEPSASQVWRIAQELGVDVVYLLDEEQDAPALPGRDEFALVNQIARELGAAESFRRLTTPNWQDRRGSEGGHDATYVHTKRVDEEPRRRRGTA